MNETQKKWYQYLTAPATIIAAFLGLIGVIVSWTTLNFRVQALEDFKLEVNIVELQRDIQEIKTNVSWIMNDLQSKK